MTLTNKEIKELNKKYKKNLTALRLDINALESKGRRTHDENVQLTKLLCYRASYTAYGGLAYNSEAYIDLLKGSLFD